MAALLIVPWFGTATAEMDCLSGNSQQDEPPPIDWMTCETDEKLSLALGMLLHDKFVSRYDPIVLDSELLKYGFDHARSAVKLPIDLHEAREILEQTKPPADYGERYAMKLSRMLGCPNSRDVLMYRRSGHDNDDRRKTGESACLSAGESAVAGKPRYEADDEVRVSYHQNRIGRYQFEALKREADLRGARPDVEKLAAAIGEDPVQDATLTEGTFELGKTIEGWQMVLQKMEPTVIYEVVIPPSLAYGERGVEGKVKPGEYLSFVMRLECAGAENPDGPPCPSTSP